MEMEVAMEENLIIQVHNKGWEDVTVSIGARPFFKLLEGNIVFFWFKWLWSNFSTTKVCPGQKKVVSKVTRMNYITYSLGSYGWKVYSIRVLRKNGEYVAECKTPLNCTWIIDDKGIYQEEDPENRCKFEMPF